MASPGRKPKSAAQRRREGNPGKRALKESTLKAEGVPVKPKDLPPAASEEWDRVVPELVRQGVAKKAHTASLVAMCVQWSIAEQARETYEREGLVEEGSMGQMVEHPMVATYTKAVAGYLRFAVEFGLTASAAMRIEVAKGEPEPFAAIGDSPRLKALKGGRG